VPWADPGLTAAGMLDAMPPDAAAMLVGTPDTVRGLARRDHLESQVAAGRGADPVTALPLEACPHVHADHSIDVVIERLRQSCGMVPVLARSDVQRVEGVITRDTIVGILVPDETTSRT
jgi:hypothetical protein